MKRIAIVLLVLLLCTLSVYGEEASQGSEAEKEALLRELPEEAAELMEGVDSQNPKFVDSVVSLFTKALERTSGGLREGLRTSGILLIIVLLCGICSTLSSGRSVCVIVGALGIFSAVMGSIGAMVQLSKDTVTELTNYSALLLPVMASAMAVSGCPVTAGGLQALTALFAQLLMRLITKVMIPGVYVFLALAAGEAALQNPLLGELREFLSWLIQKTLRILMYVFTAFLSLTGVISGGADALAVKTAKAAVSGMIPVVGSILSDASESLLAGASAVKNTIGIIGLTAVLSISILPFFRVGLQYLIMKGTAACSGTVGLKEHTALLKHLSTAMGLLLAMTGTCAVLLLISGVCYLKVTGY